jgi:hypothetical protein
MARAHGCAGEPMFRMNGAFVCSCTNDTSAIHGGRMSRAHGCAGEPMFRMNRRLMLITNSFYKAAPRLLY